MITISLSAYERETIINFNDEEKTAIVYTCNATLRRKMDQILADRPDDCKRTKNNEFHAEYEIPKKWIKIRPNRILTDEERQVLSELGKIAAAKYLGKQTEAEE